MPEQSREIVCQNAGCPNWPGEDAFCQNFEETGWDWNSVAFVDEDGNYTRMCAWNGVKREEDGKGDGEDDLR